MAVSFASEPEHWKIDARHRHRRDPKQRLGELDRRLVRAVAIEMVVAELAHLLVSDLGQPLGAEAQRGAP